MTVSDAAQTVPAQDAVFGEAYDPARERAVARRLRGARWRRLALSATAIVVAAGAAGGFTLMNRDKIRSELAPAMIAATPATEAPAPALASSTSRPVQLPGTGADPNKVQARVIVPADPEPQPVRPPVTDPAPVQMQDTQTASAPRTIPLSVQAPLPGAPPPADDAAALPATALGFAAPVPAPRPSRAP